MPRQASKKYKRPQPVPAPSGQPAPELKAWWDEFWKARSVYAYNDRIRRAGKFIADGATIDEAVHLYDLPEIFASHFEKNFPMQYGPCKTILAPKATTSKSSMTAKSCDICIRQGASGESQGVTACAEFCAGFRTVDTLRAPWIYLAFYKLLSLTDSLKYARVTG